MEIYEIIISGPLGVKKRVHVGVDLTDDNHIIFYVPVPEKYGVRLERIVSLDEDEKFGWLEILTRFFEPRVFEGLVSLEIKHVKGDDELEALLSLFKSLLEQEQ